MDLDFDPFEDILHEPPANTRAGGKFQPKGKQRPKKGTSSSLPPVLPSYAKEKSVSPLSTTLDATKSAYHPVDSSDIGADSRLNCFAGIASDTAASKGCVGDESQPKAKLQPIMETFTSISSKIPDGARNDSTVVPTAFDTVESLQSDVSDDGSKGPVSLSLTTTSVAGEPMKDVNGSSSHGKRSFEATSLLPARVEDVGSIYAHDSETAKPNGPGSLEFDSDPSNIILSEYCASNSRADEKVQTKSNAKPQLRNEGFAPLLLSPNLTIKLPTTLAFVDSHPKLSVDAMYKTMDPVDSSLPIDIDREEPVKDDEFPFPGGNLDLVNPSSKDLDPKQDSNSEDTQLAQVDSMVLDLDPFLDLFPPPAVSNARAGGKFQPRVKARPRKGKPEDIAIAFCSTTVENSATLAATSSDPPATFDAVTCDEAVVQTNSGKPESEESGSFPNLENTYILSDSTFVSDHSTKKFQPKPNEQNGKGKPSVSILPPDAHESAVPQTDFVPPEPVHISEGSTPAYTSDEMFYYSSLGFGISDSPDPTLSEFPVNQEQINLTEASRSIDTNLLQQEDVPRLSEMENFKSRKRKSSSVSNSSQKVKRSSLASGVNESGESSKRLRKKTATMELVDDSEDEAHDNSDADDEDDDYNYRLDEDNGSGDGEENTSCKTGASKRSKKPVGERTKPIRRQKKDNDAPTQMQKPRKKFSHSTRRKSRLKDLLSIPEDEVDYYKMPFKDIILLAGYKESLVVKEAKALKDAAAKEKASKDSLADEREGSHCEEGTIPTEQDGGYVNDQSNSLFNSHSFMDKTPKARWSKQDTELFYEGIRQFGTDLSMIQQLFPGRTRHQMKLKYKKEERQHPLRLSEALNCRAKDNSYFQQVIDQLQQVAAQAEQESNRDDMESLVDEEAELNPETNEEEAEVAKDDYGEDVAVEDQGGDPSKYEEDDDDVDLWSSYKSEF